VCRGVCFFFGMSKAERSLWILAVETRGWLRFNPCQSSREQDSAFIGLTLILSGKHCEDNSQSTVQECTGY
jgi:hypothetical protein